MTEHIADRFADHLRELIGCDWGLAVASNNDKTVCRERATTRIALHPEPGNPAYAVVKLCDAHLEIVMGASTPTVNPPPDKTESSEPRLKSRPERADNGNGDGDKQPTPSDEPEPEGTEPS